MAQSPLDVRLTDVESRLAFLDDTVEKLADVVARQDRELIDLRKKVDLLSERLRDLGEVIASDGSVGGSGHEPPPHY